MKRSRLGQRGSAGLCFKCFRHNTSAISAIPIGAPGWPDLDFSTASIDKKRIALAKVLSWMVEAIFAFYIVKLCSTL